MTTHANIFRTSRFFLSAACLVFLFATPLRAQLGNDNPTGVSGIYNGNVTTAGSYDPYTGNATRSVTDITVAGAVGAYPLSFTRTMNSRYTPGAGTLEMGASGSWRHSYQWSIEPHVYRTTGFNRWSYLPNVYTVNYPDGRRVSFSQASNDTRFRAGSGISDRFQQLSNVNGGMVYLLLPDGGKIAFEATVNRQEISEVTHLTESYFSYELVGIIDPYGQTTTITPSAEYTEIREPAGRYLRLFYLRAPWNGDTLLGRVEASDGRSVVYNYGSYRPDTTNYSHLGNVQYRDTAGAVYATAIYWYQPDNVDPNGRPLISACIDPMYNGAMFAIGYRFVPGSSGGVYGQLQSEHYVNHATGEVGVAVSSLSANGASRTETRGDGPTRTFNYSGGKLVNYTDFKGQTSSISYDGYGYVGAVTDQRGNTTTMVREGTIGALSRLIHPDQSYVGFAYWNENGGPYHLQIRGDERGHNTYYTRDTTNFRLTRIDYPDYPGGAYEEFTYNTFGQVLTHKKSSGGGQGFATETFEYDARGLLQKSTNPDGSTYYYYDSLDRLEHVTDPRSNNTSYQYDARGQVTRITHADGTFVQTAYDYRGNRISVTDELNHTTTFAYDDYNRLVSVTNPLNQTASLSYAQDWVNSYVQTTSNPKGVWSPTGRAIHYAYDENWRRWILREAPGTADDAWTYFGYDAAGNLTSVQDPRGYVTSFGYDSRNRRTSATNALNQTTSWQYDATNNVTRETRPDQSFRRTEYDSMNRVIDTYGFANEHTHYDRDVAGNVHEMVDAKGASYVYYYDTRNRKASAFYPPDASGTTRHEYWEYDSAGNMQRHDNPAGQVQWFLYDSRNRRTDAYWWGYVGPHIITAYDAASRVTSIRTTQADAFQTFIAFGYDDANRQIWEEQTVQDQPARRIEMGRNADGRRESLLVPAMAGVGVRYTYNQRNQVERINDVYGNNWFKYDYDVSGNMTKRQNVWASINDATRAEYDPLNRPTVWENSWAGDTVFARSRYQYDNVGREAATWRDEQSSKGEKYWYTLNDQLAIVEYNADQVWTGNPANWDRWVGYSYTPDTLNRTSVNDSGWITNYGASSLNQYTSVNGQTSQTPGYDQNFNLTSLNGAAFNYNAQNQMMSATGPGGTIDNVYDGLGRCVKRTVNGASVFILYDGWKPFLEFDGAGNNIGSYAYGPGADEILWRWTAAHGEVYYHPDRRGNVAFLLDGGGWPAEKYRYDAFGLPTITDWDGNGRTESAYGNPFMFQGREWIKELGIYDYRHRMYHPGLGRFLQKDPLGFDGSDANLFRYCGDDPVDRSDPSGLLAKRVTKPSTPAIKPREAVPFGSNRYTPTGTNIPQTVSGVWNGGSWDLSSHDYVHGMQSLGSFVLVGGLGTGGGREAGFVSTSNPVGRAIELGTRALDAIARTPQVKEGFEGGGVFFLNGKMSMEFGTEGMMTIALLPGAAGTFHLHHLIGPDPYAFSDFDAFNYIFKRPDWVHLIGILDQPSGFTIKAYIPDQGDGNGSRLSWIRANDHTPGFEKGH